MAKESPIFLNYLEKTDPKFHAQVVSLFDLAMAPGELDARTKVLISMALDALAGAGQAVKALAGAARGMGATDGQIAEALRLGPTWWRGTRSSRRHGRPLRGRS